MFRGKVVNFPTGCTLSLSLFLFSVPVIIPAIDNLISELLQFRWCNGEGGGGGGGCWRSGKGEEVLRSGWKLYTWTHSVHVPRVYLGKVELTYWDRSDRLVAFMYPPCWRAAPKRSPSSFFFLFPLFTRHHPWTKLQLLYTWAEYRGREELKEIRKWNISLHLKYFFCIKKWKRRLYRMWIIVTEIIEESEVNRFG